MYWPCGVPEVFAYHGTRHAQNEVDSDQNGREVSDTEHESERVNGHGSGVTDHDAHSEASKSYPTNGIIDVRTTRSDHVFATISKAGLQIWSNRPTVVLASLDRSAKSLATYGDNLAVFFRPDASVVVIRTALSYLITYSLESDPTARVFQQHLDNTQSRRQSIVRNFGSNDAAGLSELILRFKRAIKIDAGINTAYALDQELVVATVKPAAVQCIKWESQKGMSQASAQLLNKMDWMEHKSPPRFMVQDRAMSLSVWLTDDGAGYAVQRTRPPVVRYGSSDDVQRAKGSSSPTIKLFDGFCFHTPTSPDDRAIIATINARFSLIAVATAGGRLLCYAARDYVGNIPLSHSFILPVSASAAGKLTCLTWSPDGYCLFAGYDKGWASWSVFGKEGWTSFHSSFAHSSANDENWLHGVKTANWTSGGAELILTCQDDDRIWRLQLSRSAAVGCFSCANLVRALLQSPTELAIYCGHEMPDLTSVSNDASLWHHAQYPAAYMHNQWPIRASVVSQDGRYIAVAGRRGLAHYSVQSGRWKTFSDYTAENSFSIRGGMCWFNHILAAASESSNGYSLRLYSRDSELGPTPLHTENFSMPIAFIGPSGEDSLLVYTYENILYHYVINILQRGAQLMQVGQIAFHGLVRAPSRVRSVSWVLPDSQLRNGDPARDVEHAAVLFLVDDKLVLLQPIRSEENSARYDMRVIAQHVEYYILMRDQIYFNINDPVGESMPPTPSIGGSYNTESQTHFSLRDSLWIFVGDDLRMWTDVRDVIRTAPGEGSSFASTLLSMPVDFYPLSILLNKAVILGIESELLQRRDVSFAQFRTLIRSQLLLPYVLRYQLCIANNTAAAFGLANQYQHLSYFPHALEILLHHVLDDTVDQPLKDSRQRANQPEPLPAVLSFLQIVLLPITYLSTVVQCIRKTEVTSWGYLFAHIPPPLTLFEQSLEHDDLKTASGWLIVLHGLEDDDNDDDLNDDTQQQLEQQVVRLMILAKSQEDYELCSELAHFMVNIDPRGDTLRRVMAKVGFRDEPVANSGHQHMGLGLELPARIIVKRQPSRSNVLQVSPVTQQEEDLKSAEVNKDLGVSRRSPGDYFSASPGLDKTRQG